VTTPGAPNPGAIGTGGTCSPTPIICGGCLESFLPKCGFGGTWVAGGGVYYMEAIYNNNRAFVADSGKAFSSTFASQNFNNNLQVAPLAFVGYSWDNGFGIRFRWFGFNQNQSAGTTIGSGNITVFDASGNNTIGFGKGTTIVANSHLYLSAYDLEATYNTTIGKWLLIGSAGARYAQINQAYSIASVDAAGVALAGSGSNHDFNGFGPTVSLEGHRQIGCSGFGVYASARASILFGSGHLSSGSVTGPASDIGFTSSTASGSQTSVIPVGEMEIGGEWSKAWGRFRVFAQVGVIGQIWWGTGNAAEPTIFSSGSPSNLGFIGGVARAGIAF